MSTLSRRLLSRLYHDLAELRDSPYPGVEVFTDDADIRKSCLVLTPPCGPWKDLALHFDVSIPEEWPSSPPRISISVCGIRHPNLFGSYICCDLLKPYDGYISKGYTGGYSPALTLRGLFLQFLTFFSSTKIDQEHGGGYIEVEDCIQTWFAIEKDIIGEALPGRCTGCSLDYYYPTCGSSMLGRWWKNIKGSPIVLRTSPCTGGELVETVKRCDSAPSRIHKFEQPSATWTATYVALSAWKCNKCPYGSVDLPHHQAASSRSVDPGSPMILCSIPSRCVIDILNDDTLLEIAHHLPWESLIYFSKAYPRFRALVTSTHTLIRRELRCFFLRSPLTECILGVGVCHDRGSRLSSDFDWLSEEAYQDHKILRSVEKREFKYFLPLAFNKAHFERAQERILYHLSRIESGLTSRMHQAPNSVGVIYNMMNNIVIALMKSCDSVLEGKGTVTLLHASEKAVVSYCHLFHLLICLARTRPAILKDATNRLRRFIAKPESRVKAVVPDIGELMVMIMLVLALPCVDDGVKISWDTLAGPFLEEAMVRNVRWILKEFEELEILEQGESDYRLEKTFIGARTSLRLLMFQRTFLRVFVNTYGSNITQLDDDYGFPEPEIPGLMVEEIKKIYKVDTWPAFFERVQYARKSTLSKATFSDMLRQVIIRSGQRGESYHIPMSQAKKQRVAAKRSRLEAEWRRNLKFRQ